MRLRAERLKQEAEANKEKQAEYDEAKTHHDAFEQDYQQTLQQQQFRITEAEALELKALYRACTKICHPDKVAQEQKQEATELQAQLNEAYAKNDLAAVKAGRRRPWDVTPYAVFPLPDMTADVGGATIDPRTGRIYISAKFGNHTLPVVHVFKAQ